MEEYDPNHKTFTQTKSSILRSRNKTKNEENQSYEPIKPKRGRPTFTFIRHKKVSSDQIYNALNVVELGLLRLEANYSVLSLDIHIEQEKSVFEIFDRMIMKFNEKNINSHVLEICREFINMITIQTELKATLEIVCFITKIAEFLANEDINQQKKNNRNTSLFNSYYFGLFFKSNIFSFAKYPIEFYLELVIIFSQWLFQMSYSDQEIRRRE